MEGCIENRDVIVGRGRLQVGKFVSGQVQEASDRVILRMERVGSRVRALCSADGAAWFSVGEVEFPVEGTLKVGLHAIGMIDRTIYHGVYPDGTAIRFESFTLWGLDH